MTDQSRLEDDFLGHLWPPFTQLSGLKPTIMERAEGAIVYDTEGNAYIDAFASLWTVNVGHGRKEIFDAIQAQAEKLAIYHIFQIANEPSIRLAAKVASLMPGDLNHVFLTLGGGESVETAVKMARQYWRNKGQGTKFMVMFRDRSYHGTTMTATSAQGLPMNRAKFEPLLPGFIKLGAPYCYRCAWNKTYGEDCAMECAKVVEQEIAFYGPENVGTMLGETMIGTGGVIPPPAEYWPMVCQICKANDVLVINDEVITGFGRSGTWFGFEQFGSEPDLVTLAKGLSSGYLPLGAVGARDHVFEAFLGGPAEAFMSGATYDGHPLCSAAGLANLEIVEREHLVERCHEVGRLHAGRPEDAASPSHRGRRARRRAGRRHRVRAGQDDQGMVPAGSGRGGQGARRGLPAGRVRTAARRRPLSRRGAAFHYHHGANRRDSPGARRVDRDGRKGAWVLGAQRRSRRPERRRRSRSQD